MNNLKLVTPSWTRSFISPKLSAGNVGHDAVKGVIADGFARGLAIQVSKAWRSAWPLYWIAKSMSVVVPPNAAARVPVSKSSALVVPPKGMSRCVCTSMPPGRTSLFAASMILVAFVRRQIASDGGDLAVRDGDVGDVGVGGGDDGAVLDDRVEAHRVPPRCCGMRRELYATLPLLSSARSDVRWSNDAAGRDCAAHARASSSRRCHSKRRGLARGTCLLPPPANSRFLTRALRVFGMTGF